MEERIVPEGALRKREMQQQGSAAERSGKSALDEGSKILAQGRRKHQEINILISQVMM